MTSDMRRPVLLPGWALYSIWGYDTGMETYFAQLWPDEAGGGGDPVVWISGLRKPIRTLEELASEIFTATGVPRETVLAMLQAEPGSPGEDRFATDAGV